MKEIKELVSGNKLEGQDVLVISKAIATTSKGDEYCKLTVRDSSGEISGNAWGFDENASTFHTFKVGDVIKIWAAVSTYKDQNQVTVSRTERSFAPIENFGKKTKFDIDQLWGSLVNLIGTFKEPMTKFVAEEILLNNKMVEVAIRKCPAATNVHNNWFGGLLEHVWSLCTMADPIITHYKKNYYPELSRDKVLFGLIMHDAGKIVEYDYENPAFPIKGIGLLTNHMVLGPAWVYEKCGLFMDSWIQTPYGTGEDFKLERAQLMHVLAAHHGKQEWGSPVVPATLEALLVHHLDNLDSKMMHAIDLIEKGDGQIKGFSNRSYFERTSFYRNKRD